MRSPLVYLTLTKLKNQIKALLKSPAKLIYGLFLIAMFALVIYSSSFMEEDGGPAVYRDFSEFAAILTLLYTVMFLVVFVNGSAGKASMFTMPDTSLLFPSPVSPRRVLFYGLIKQLGTSLLLGFFLLFQYSWVHQLYGITYGGLLLAVGGYAVSLFAAQLCAMAVYSRSSGKENASHWIKTAVYGSALLYVLAAAFTCRGSLSALLSGEGGLDGLLSEACAFFSDFPGLLFPVSGWISALFGGLLSGNLILAGTGGALLLILFAALVFLIATSKNNYYEDALQGAETAQSLVTAQKEGQFQETAPKHVRLGKIGLKKGWGASAIYYKHKVENRRSGVFCLSSMSLLFAVIIIAFSFFMQGLEDADDGILIGVFAMGTYMQLFSVALGRFNRELTKPYLYLLPEPPLKKLLYALLESLVSEGVEAVLIFIPVGLILHASPLDILGCIVARFSFGLLFTAGNVLVERVFGMVKSKGLILLFYFLSLLVLSIPGIVLGISLSILFGLLPGLSLGFLPAFLGMAVPNALLSLLVLFLCRNLLQYADLTNR